MVETQDTADTTLATDTIVGSPLSDRFILAHMEAGNIVIQPFNERHLQNSSFDVTLGRYFYEEQRPGPDFTFFNPYYEKHIGKAWGKSHQAERARVLMEKFDFPQDAWTGINPEDEVIIFSPGSTYLCHTEEFIGMRNVGTTMMKARSTLGRDHIEVCKCAGWGDNGYTNRWTMEITNNSEHFYIPLVVGTRVAQIVFFYTGETDRPYIGTGSYQNTPDLENLQSEWKPENMLPKPLKTN